MAPFTARSRSSASSILTTLDGGVARGYAGIPQVERAIAVHLCPQNAATWRNRPRLPSKACKLTAALAAKAYSAAGQAASALHALGVGSILKVHQAKALKQLHEGSIDPGLMQELRTATSALATLPEPEVGMVPRYTVSGYHPAVSPLPQPLDGPCLSTGRGAPRTSVPAYCGHNRCLQHGLGRYMQWAGSLGEAANRLGGIQSHRMSQLARHLLLWSPTQFKSLRAVHIPGKLNRAADALSRQLSFPGEWRLHPETIRLIWSRFGEAQVDLFASLEYSYCQLYFSLTEGPLGTDALAHSWPRP